jgi:hypothetical protein
MKQTLQDRLRRLARGACPIHGRRMAQVMGYNVICERRDCGITGRVPDGPLVLDRKWAFLLVPPAKVGHHPPAKVGRLSC